MRVYLCSSSRTEKVRRSPWHPRCSEAHSYWEEKESSLRLVRKCTREITCGWWFGWTTAMSPSCSVFEQRSFFPQKGSSCGITPILMLSVVWRSLAVSPLDLTLLGTAWSLSTWEFSSGFTPGPVEVTGRRAASGSSVLRTVGCPEGGGDWQARLHIASVFKVHPFCPTLRSNGAKFAQSLWDMDTPLRKLERYTQGTRRSRGHKCVWRQGSAFQSRNQTIHQTPSPTRSVWPHHNVQRISS